MNVDINSLQIDPIYHRSDREIRLEFGRATTIDEVVLQLELLIHDCIKSNDRIGFFATLYHKVTVRVQEGINRKEFENPARMEKFDVIFANRFLNAVQLFRDNKIPTMPWKLTFQSARKFDLLVVQHLMLGMNAHINLDLGIAAVESASGQNVQEIRKDFNSINNILASMVLEVLTDLNQVSPFLSLFGLHSGNSSLVIQFSITNAREGSWAFAEELLAKKDFEYDSCINARIDSIYKLGQSLVEVRGLLNLTKWVIWAFEWKQPHKIINAMFEARKLYFHTDPKKEEVSS
ncbi:MAG TPA: DUF5995 family protein [Saprospiraceae bacterium]|nr:DUF5995 family protein [Saprospiraceae bacterium]